MTGAGPIVVTGAAGYLGGRVLDRLRAAGVPARGLGRRSGPGITACDLTDDSAARTIAGLDPRAVVHCAAIVPADAAGYADEDAARLSLAMLESVIAARPRHLVFASSMTVYGAAPPTPAGEDDAPPPGGGYAGGKRRAELRLLAEKDLAVTVLRLPGLFGPPRQGGLLYNVARALARGEAPRLTEHPPLWAALHVDDAAGMIVKAALGGPAGKRVLNAGSAGRFSTTRAVNALARQFGLGPLTDMPAPEFEFNLDRLKTTLGLPDHTFESRLAELCRDVRAEAAEARVGHA